MRPHLCWMGFGCLKVRPGVGTGGPAETDAGELCLHGSLSPDTALPQNWTEFFFGGVVSPTVRTSAFVTEVRMLGDEAVW